MDYEEILSTIYAVGSGGLDELPSQVMFGAMAINNESEKLSSGQIAEALRALCDNLNMALEAYER